MNVGQLEKELDILGVPKKYYSINGHLATIRIYLIMYILNGNIFIMMKKGIRKDIKALIMKMKLANIF